MASKRIGRPRESRRRIDTFARRLAKARSSIGLSQQEAAKELGVAWRTYIRYELGERAPWGPAIPFFEAWIERAKERAKGSRDHAKKA